MAAALFSALLHAAWNAAVKADREPALMMAGQMLGSALLALPLLLWAGLPAAAAWPWLLGSTLINIAAINAMLRAYRDGGFGTVYAIIRATSVLGVVPLAALLSGERLGLAALLGVALIVAALAVLGLGLRGSAALPRRALGWTLAAGLCSSCYVVLDAQGSRHAGSPVAYGAAVSVVNALWMCLQLARVRGAPWRWLPLCGWKVLPLAAAAMLSYLLILWVFTQAPIAATAALRDTSALWAMLIGVLWLKERLTLARLLALLLAAAGVPLLRLG